jgi:ElaB/YqjD/DUF883 family membrane-anchored ribosome-binding protein
MSSFSSSPLNSPTHPIADSAHALMDATTSAAANALQVANRASRESLQAFTDSAGQLAQDSAAAMRERALRLRDSSAGYVRERPLQAMLIAAGTGAALALLLRLLVRAGLPR